MRSDGVEDERSVVARLIDRAGAPPEGELWGGDDTAVVLVDGHPLLFATDAVVVGVHVLPGVEYLEDAGWKALVRNVSDIAAMGGTPTHAVAAVTGATADELDYLQRGLLAASRAYACPVVGGDLSSGEGIVCTVAIVGRAGDAPLVLRSGARPDDVLYVTGSLGGASAGLRTLLKEPGATSDAIDRHRRPVARVGEGAAAAAFGASAMIDLSDGLAIDLHRLADASGVGFAITAPPIFPGATLEDALEGGEDYELLFAGPPGDRIPSGFAARGLRPPIPIGRCTTEREVRTLDGRNLLPRGWQHELSERE